MVDHIIS